MEKSDIENMLIQLIHLRGERLQYVSGYEAMRQRIIPPEVKKELEELNEEEKTTLLPLDARISALEEEIKTAVLMLGESVIVKGVAQAIYNHGRITWDTEGLEGLAVAIPELLRFKRVGRPYVAIK